MAAIEAVLALLTKRLRGVETAVVEVRKSEGPSGIDGKDGRDGIDGKDGRDGTDGKDGRDGTDGKDGRDGIDGKDGRDGTDGKDGSTPDHQWRDKDLRFKKPDGSWGKWINLQGPKGERGSGGGVVSVAGGGVDVGSTPTSGEVLVGDTMLIVREGQLFRVPISLSTGGSAPANAVTVNGQFVTVNGQYVVKT